MAQKLICLTVVVSSVVSVVIMDRWKRLLKTLKHTALTLPSTFAWWHHWPVKSLFLNLKGLLVSFLSNARMCEFTCFAMACFWLKRTKNVGYSERTVCSLTKLPIVSWITKHYQSVPGWKLDIEALCWYTCCRCRCFDLDWYFRG